MKKKILALVLACVMSTSIGVYGADLDLSTYSDDEIVALYDSIAKEIVDRKIEKTAELTAGTYIGSDDIPVGKYVFTTVHVDDGKNHGIIEYYTKEDIDNDSLSLYENVTEWDDAESFMIDIADGSKLVIPIKMTATIYTGLKFE